MMRTVVTLVLAAACGERAYEPSDLQGSGSSFAYSQAMAAVWWGDPPSPAVASVVLGTKSVEILGQTDGRPEVLSVLVGPGGSCEPYQISSSPTGRRLLVLDACRHWEVDTTTAEVSPSKLQQSVLFARFATSGEGYIANTGGWVGLADLSGSLMREWEAPSVVLFARGFIDQPIVEVRTAPFLQVSQGLIEFGATMPLPFVSDDFASTIEGVDRVQPVPGCDGMQVGVARFAGALAFAPAVLMRVDEREVLIEDAFGSSDAQGIAPMDSGRILILLGSGIELWTAGCSRSEVRLITRTEFNYAPRVVDGCEEPSGCPMGRSARSIAIGVPQDLGVAWLYDGFSVTEVLPTAERVEVRTFPIHKRRYDLIR